MFFFLFVKSDIWFVTEKYIRIEQIYSLSLKKEQEEYI